MTYKTVTVGGECEEHGEWEMFYVVPEHVSGADILLAPEEVDVFCECHEKANADLVVSLLNNAARH